MSLKTRFRAVHCLCLLFFEAMHAQGSQMDILPSDNSIDAQLKCKETTQVLTLTDDNAFVTGDPYEACLVLDWGGMAVNDGKVNIGNVMTEILTNPADGVEKLVVMDRKCSYHENHFGILLPKWCASDIKNKDGYCSTSKHCGTGVCCRNSEEYSDVKGCHCNNKRFPYTKQGNENHRCNDNGRVGTEDKHHCHPSVKNAYCTCVGIPQDKIKTHYANANSIMQQCPPCSPGKYGDGCSLNDQGSLQSSCIDCQKGKYNDGTTYNTSCLDCELGSVQPSTGQSSCLECPLGQYAKDKETCEECLTCDDNEVNPMCNERRSDNTGVCVCDKGYYKDAFTCQPVPEGFFKDTSGDEATGKQCTRERGSFFTTINVGSTSINDCVCEQNYVHDTKEDKCNACKGDTPYNPINGSGCRACYRYEYWTNNACQNLSRMELSFESSVLKIQDQDKYRPFETPDTITQQSRNKPLPQNSYLDINTHKPESCPKCPVYHELQACGSPHTTLQGQNQGLKKVWVTWKDGNQISRQHLITTPISEDGTSTFDSYDFWKQMNQQNDLQIRREGKCVRCNTCPSGKYQSKCIDGDDGTCRDCKTDASECSNVQGQHFYLFHNLSTYINEQWTGGCNLFPNMAQKDYECRPCETWTRKGDDYFLLLGCGTTSQDTRWDEDKVTDEEKKLSQKTVDNSNPNHYAEYQTRIPYCAPGWYVDTSDDNDKCPLSTDTTSTEPWNPECCKKCGDISSAQKKRGSNFKPCTGATNKDTEEYVDRCENGHYTDMVNGTQTCTRCTTC